MTLSELLTAYADGGGTLTGEALRRSVQEAWPLMLLETRNRVLGVDPESETGEAVRQCFDALVEAASGDPGALRSETLGQWSRTFQDSGRSREETLRMILRQYLGETGLLYRGWNP